MQKNMSYAALGISLLVLMALFGCPGGGGGGPGGLSAKAVSGGIEITWSPSQQADVTGYNVYRSTESGQLGTKINPTLITSTSYKDENVQNGAIYYYTVRSVDANGNEDQNTAQASASAQTQAPQDLQISIDGGKEYASSPDVTLYLSAQGAAECRYSNDATTWSDWSAYAAQKSWTLSDGDGMKDVYYQCKDDVGNTAVPTSAAIHLDTNEPTITIHSPGSGQSYARTFNLTFTVDDPVFSTVTCSGDLDGSAIAIGVIDSGKQDTTQVTASTGQHTLKLTCKDQLHTATQSVTFNVVEKPDVQIHIESGSGYVDTRHVTIDVMASGADECRFENGGEGWSGWQPYTQSIQWTLTSGEGTKYVYAECRKDGYISNMVYDTVVLDTTPPPYISIEINNGDEWTNSRDVKLGLYCYAADQCRYSNEGGPWSGWSSYTTKKSWQLSSGDGDKTVYYECKDSNGKSLGKADAEISYSKKEPNPPSSMSIKINGGESHTSDPDVTLALYAKNANECRFKNEVGSWTGWYAYSTSRDWTLSDGGGKKTVYYQCRNDYGNQDTHATIYLDTGPPPPVDDLSASVDGDDVHLSWGRVEDDGSGIAYYNVYRSNTDLGLFSKIGTSKRTTYEDTGLSPGNYAYDVRAVDQSGAEGPRSNGATADVKGSDEPGGDVDKHGCKGSAGYTWCEPLKKCVREWEEPCPLTGEEGPGPEMPDE